MQAVIAVIKLPTWNARDGPKAKYFQSGPTLLSQ